LPAASDDLGLVAAVSRSTRTAARPYVDDALLAIRDVATLVGTHRGLACVLDV
jgi:hypothetical protein